MSVRTNRERINGTLLEVVLGVHSDNAVELVQGYLLWSEVYTVVSNTVRDPFGINVLERVDTKCTVESDSIEDAL